MLFDKHRLWFPYVALTVVLLCIRDKEESEKLVAFLMAGMTIFIIVSAVFPNGHNLRPKTFAQDNIFIDLIKNLYATDTPTNILPSIHVYNSVAIMIAVWRSKCCHISSLKIEKHCEINHCIHSHNSQ